MGSSCITHYWHFTDITMIIRNTDLISHRHHASAKYSLILGFLLVFVFALCNLKSGAINYSWHELASTLSHPLYHSLASINIFQVRLPMVLMAIMAGAGLAVSGLLLQRVTRNPLACPSLLGIEYGTAFSVILSHMFFMPHLNRSAVLGIAFLGGLITYLLMQIIISKTKASVIGITLIGVAFNTLYYSLIQAILIAFPYQAQGILYDLNGSLQGINLNDIKIIVIPFCLLLAIAFLFSRRLPLLDLDEEQAVSLGVPIKFYRLILLALSILLATLITSLTGPLLFFGLIIPHFIKPFSPAHSSISMLFCAVFGAFFLLIAAWLAHIISPLTPPPVGLVILLMSAPILLLISKRYLAYDEI